MIFLFFAPYFLILGGFKIFKKGFQVFTPGNILTFALQMALIVIIYKTSFYLNPLANLLPVAGAIILIPISEYVVTPLLVLSYGMLHKLTIWNKLELWQKYAILFILFHWVLFFFTGYIIDGHPPIPFMLLEAPVFLFGWLLVLFAKSIGVLRYFQTFTGELNIIGVFLFILIASLTYGFIGIAFASLVKRLRTNK